MRLTSTLKPLLGAVLAAGLLAGCGSNSKSSNAAQIAAPNMGVNSYLWRASLETLNFMPLEQVDPFGGVIVTDWYANAQVPNERFKANVYILDTNLRADALKATIFKQNRTVNGWEDANVDADTARQIENAILTRARQLYIATQDSQ
ncbi:DUF3576 domain-containing protein [Litorimonas sp. WD9-15]|uniref:DUF3576 domain-containing protein n=1 Tax=Litorimonas sp. WD9-15 TaxID=3418716 RepID=UPI003D05346C